MVDMLPFLNLRQQDSVFLDYLPDGQPSGLLLALAQQCAFFISPTPKFNLTICLGKI